MPRTFFLNSANEEGCFSSVTFDNKWVIRVYSVHACTNVKCRQDNEKQLPGQQLYNDKT